MNPLNTKNQETSSPFLYTTPDRLVLDFAVRGLVVLSPESLGIPATVHEQVYTQEKAVHDTGVRVTPANVPAVLDLLKAPGLVAACNQLVGKNWAIVPLHPQCLIYQRRPRSALAQG